MAIRTLGCKVNRADSDALAESLLAAGATIVEEHDADVVIVNSCTVTSEADSKTRKAARQALGRPGRPTVVVTGCAAALEADALRAIDARLVVEPDRDRVVDRVTGLAVERAEGRSEAAAPQLRTRVAVKVQDGCDDRCAYCIVPDARGGSRSVPARDVVERVEALVAAGTREIVVAGINVGRYRDGDGGASLAQLLVRVAATGAARIRMSSIEPEDLTPALLETLSVVGSVAPHLHVPLQSGCDRTLAAMRRRYDTAAFSDALARVRDALPGVAVTTDVMVGFPGETDEDHESSLAFVEGAGFTRLHVFRYSPRPGTPAAGMPEQVDPRVSDARAAAMRSLGERMASAYAVSRVGTTASVLVETAGDWVASGTSADYLHVGFKQDPQQPVRPGDIVDVELTAAERAAAFGHLVRW